MGPDTSGKCSIKSTKGGVIITITAKSRPKLKVYYDDNPFQTRVNILSKVKMVGNKGLENKESNKDHV